MRARWLARLLVVALFAVLSLACGPAPEAEKKASTLDSLVASGVLRVGVEAEDYHPHHFRREDGSWDGFEMALVGKLTEGLNVEPEFVPTKWDVLITELRNGKYDLIASTLSNTPERAKLVDFSDPYYTEKVSLLLNKSIADEIESYEDLDNNRYAVTFRINTLNATTATKYFPNAEKKPFQKEEDAFQEVVRGKAAAYVGDSQFVKQLAAKNQDTAVAFDTHLTMSQVCFAIRKDDPDFLERLNAFLDTIKNDNPDGSGKSTYDQLYEEYGLL